MSSSVSPTLYGHVEKLKKRRPNIVITPDALIRENLGITSLEMISILTDICDRHGIDLMSLSEQDLAQMKTLSDIVAILDGRMARAA